MTKRSSQPEKPQIDKFKETAKQVETDDSDEAFDRALKKVARPPKKPGKRA
jgi:hypothetical protein